MGSDDCRPVIEDLKKDKKNRRPGELFGILEGFGFRMHPRTKGSHRAFSKPNCAIGVSIPENVRHVLPAYVRQVIRALEECCDD